MSNVRIGWAGLVLKEKMNSPFIDETGTTLEITETFNVNYANAAAAITVRGFTYGDSWPSSPYTSAVLKRITIRKAGPKNSEVVYIWRAPEAVGTITKEGDSNVIEIPIGQHPAATSQNYDEANKIGIGDWEGVESWLSPQPIYKRTEVLSAFEFTEANLVQNVGKLFTTLQMSNKGLIGATDKKWLKMSLNVTEQGDEFSKTESWQFADRGWDDVIYDVAS